MFKLSKFLIDLGIMLSVFWLGCYITGFALRHPVFLLLAVGIESLVFLSWEVESHEKRKNSKDDYEEL